MPEIKQDIRTATFIVAANDSLHKNMADYVCDGVNDHLEIQAALDALPATGGEVLLLDGTYNIEVNLVMDSNQTLRGCGRNTILRTATDGVDIITASGSPGSEKIGILIADLRIIGSLTANNYDGIHFFYVDYSRIENVVSENNYESSGIALAYCNMNVVTGCSCCTNESYGIELSYSQHTVVIGNRCWDNGMSGIHVGGNYNRIAENDCQTNGENGIDVVGDNNVVTGNICVANSQKTDNHYNNIVLSSSDYNLIANNLCRQGTEANQPKWGLNISAACVKNIVQGNDLHDAGKTANLDDVGTLTIVESDNREIEITQIKVYRNVKNTSGGPLAAGDVVILKGVAGDLEIDTTVVQGDDKVYGMVAEAIADAASGYVQVKGKTTALKVNGTIDIAIGDPLGTFTEVGIAMQAQAGDMAFAIALEGYTADDSLGVIDAYIKSPWD